ncbi:MAG: methionine--tRNA ligase, partial [Candidatus Gracilibacteria bacterium]|nr:methionine--tRNA ligase [Candidatus Gracilibacteria bacterium]
SQKAVIKAEEAGKPIMEYLDSMAESHKEVWDYFGISYTDFIRTTSERHHEVVQNVLQKCFDKGDVYEGEYEGMYCVGCESFKKDEDLVFMNKTTKDTFPIKKGVKETDNICKVCPDHLKTPDSIKEKNYFFKLTKYQTWIEEFYENNPDFVQPDFRFNEVKAFVKRGLEDFSISRETNTFGIALPFDENQVTYVWFDALFNYYTSCKKSLNQETEDYVDESKIFWEASDDNKREILHVVGKDIIRFHAIFWPAMLASYFDLGKEIDGVLRYQKSDNNFLPNKILAGGYFTIDGQKMSKTIGNVIEPIEYAEKYGKDLLSLYMLSAFHIGNDGDYDRIEAIKNYNAKLANNFGNLVNRVVVLTLRLEEYKNLEKTLDGSIAEEIQKYQQEASDSMKKYDLKNTLDSTFFFLDKLNKYADVTEPWKMIKDTDQDGKTAEVLYTLAEGVRQVGLNLYAFFPEKMCELFIKLGCENYPEQLENGKLKVLQEKTEIFHITEKGEALFSRIDLDK